MFVSGDCLYRWIYFIGLFTIEVDFWVVGLGVDFDLFA